MLRQRHGERNFKIAAKVLAIMVVFLAFVDQIRPADQSATAPSVEPAIKSVEERLSLLECQYLGGMRGPDGLYQARSQINGPTDPNRS